MDEKIVETLPLQGWKVFDGEKMASAKSLHLTRPFHVWKIKTKTREIECADHHFLFYEDGCKVMACELHPGDSIQVDGGVEEVISIEKSGSVEKMYDMEMDTNDHKWSTNGIVSHNTTTCTAFILHYVLFNQDKKVAILANKGAQAREIMSRIELAYLHLPKWLQCGVKTWNKGSMELANGSSIISSTTSSDSIRGQSYSCVVKGTLVTLKNNNGEKEVVGIEEAEDERFSVYREVLTPSGFQKHDGLASRKSTQLVEILLENGYHLKCTLDHRVLLASDSFVEARDVKAGDRLKFIAAGHSEVKTVRLLKESEVVYDLLNVRNGNVYWTNGMASHNCVLIDECIAGKETVRVRKKSDHREMQVSLEEFWNMV